MNVLLTGVAGFVGWKTAELLLRQGHKVIGIDNLNNYYDPNLKLWRLKRLGIICAPEENAKPIYSKKDGFVFHQLDIEDQVAVEHLFQQQTFDAVINLAARAGVRSSIENPYVYFRTNANGVVNILEAMRRNGVGKLVLASTSSLYAGQAIPFLESLPVNTPISPYAASKKAAETAAYTWHHLYGIDVSICRYFTVYGPAGRPDMSPLRFLKWIDRGDSIQLYGDGSQRRDFTYIDDVADGTIRALQAVGFEIFNLGGGNKPVAINTMIGAFEECLGKKAKIKYLPFNKGDMKDTQAENTKAREYLGWRPTVSPEAGFKQTASWYMEYPDSFQI